VDISCFTGENGISTYQKEMVTALAARKEALEMKLKEKIEELRQLCFREAVSQCLSLYLRYYLLSLHVFQYDQHRGEMQWDAYTAHAV
jgi:hypothetical protein